MAAKGKYCEEIVKEICSMIESDSYTIREICNSVKINIDTYYDWLKNKTDFSEAIKKAEVIRRNFFLAEAEKSIIKKIQGYTFQEKHTTYISGKENKPIIKEQKVIEKYYAPDTAAIIFTLTNSNPEKWKNKQYTDVTSGGETISAIDLRVITSKEEIINENKK